MQWKRFILPNGHGAQDVEENEGAFGVVISGQVAVAETLDPRDWGKGKFRNHTTVKSGAVLQIMLFHKFIVILFSNYQGYY